MSDQVTSAVVLAFPARPDDRLRHALRSLEAALAEQSAAVAGLRAELGALSGVLSGLETSMTFYAGALDHAAAAVAGAGQAARALETTADGLLRTARG
jgi:hypothetical protein